MSTQLRPMREDEYDPFYAEGVEFYARDMVENGGFAPDAAHAKSIADWAAALPDGFGSPDNFLRIVEDGDRSVVGLVWWAIRPNPFGGTRAFLYEIRIDEAARGRGHGRAAMLALEDEVRAQGLDRLELNVFGGNEVARGLYRSLGFAESAVYMTKNLS